VHSFRIKIFRAIDDEDSCERFMEGHMNVLKIYGITEITTANKSWFYNPDSYVLLAETLDGQKVVGGIRVHVAGGTQPLPIEDAISELDNSIHDRVKTKAIKGTGELCGLWNSREVAGMGISKLLMRAGISVTTQIKLSSLFALCAPVTVPMVGKVGFVVEKSLGKEGTFYYPKSDLIATAVMIHDLIILDNAENHERQVIFELRKNPRQSRMEDGNKGEIEVEYNLTLDK
jgi:hypothetical protein